MRGRRLTRRSLITGRELQGNLHTLGYFSAYVCAGTPQTKFDLIVDTGSSLTAMPCRDCTHCGTHRHASPAGCNVGIGAPPPRAVG